MTLSPMRWSARDHPRSRGVYLTLPSQSPHATGSSPLARGLRSGGRRPNRWYGIIPARAGFTSKRPPAPWPTGDHPRSRGVYSLPCGHLPIILGSSPLARGLPRQKGGRPRRRGIIPARAGFTQWSAQKHLLNSDHPRSRGVYPGGGHSQTMSAGSSPLARGLRLETVNPVVM